MLLSQTPSARASLQCSGEILIDVCCITFVIVYVIVSLLRPTHQVPASLMEEAERAAKAALEDSDM